MSLIVKIENMNIVSAYRYFVHRTYAQQITAFGPGEPRIFRLFSTTLLLYFNALTIFVWFEIATGYRMKFSAIYGLIGAVILLVANYYFVFHNDKSKSVISELESETEFQRKRRAIWCWVYEIGTFVIFFGSVYVLSPYSE